jgi:hypothetical protein
LALPKEGRNNKGYQCYQTCTREYRIEMLAENYNRIVAYFATQYEMDVVRRDRQNVF